MSGGWPQGANLCNGLAIGVSETGAQYGTAVATSSSGNTLGSWVQLTAATASDAAFLCMAVQVTGYNDYAIDIGIGASGSEVVLAQQIYIPGNSASGSIGIPCSIPAGTRVAARCQGSSGSLTCYVTLALFDSSMAAIGDSAGAQAIGFSAGSTSGTTINSSATPNVKGSYTQLTASTPRDYNGFTIMVSAGFVGSSADAALDIAVGASGSEAIVLPDYCFQITSYQLWSPFSPIFWVPIPAGTRVSARCAWNYTSALALNTALLGILL